MFLHDEISMCFMLCKLQSLQSLDRKVHRVRAKGPIRIMVLEGPIETH